LSDEKDRGENEINEIVNRVYRFTEDDEITPEKYQE